MRILVMAKQAADSLRHCKMQGFLTWSWLTSAKESVLWEKQRHIGPSGTRSTLLESGLASVKYVLLRHNLTAIRPGSKIHGWYQQRIRIFHYVWGDLLHPACRRLPFWGDPSNTARYCLMSNPRLKCVSSGSFSLRNTSQSGSRRPVGEKSWKTFGEEF